jgi:hypothetical protein
MAGNVASVQKSISDAAVRAAQVRAAVKQTVTAPAKPDGGQSR